MEWLVEQFIVRFRPRTGWVPALTAFAAICCVSFAAASNTLNPPSTPFFWAGLLGFFLGLRLAPSRGKQLDARALPRLAALVWGVVFVGALVVLPVDEALPPLGLVIQDIGGWLAWTRRMWDESTLASPLPAVPFPGSRTGNFFAESLPRFWRDLSAAPNNDKAGARLLVGTGGVLLTLIGAVTLGWGLQRGKNLLSWQLPLLVALVAVTIFGAASGIWLVGGLGLLLLLTISTAYNGAAAEWDRQHTDYAPEMQHDLLAWGGVFIVALLGIALILPAWLNNPFSNGVWGDVTPPSGLAALEQEPPPYRPPPPAPIGLSSLPALALGTSLVQGDSEQIALRITVDKPLPESQFPRYWRARLFNIYNGRAWTTNARVSAQTPLAVPDDASDVVVQTVEDFRKQRDILVGLPNVIGFTIPTSAERIDDGTLTAVTAEEPPRRYQTLSSLQEQVLPPDPTKPPPDMRTFLQLPTLPPRVGETARALTKDSLSTYDKALALEAFLRELPYSYQVTAPPAQGDVVEQFLFDMRQGYCTYYASAMAVLARSIGIPARVAIGYSTGEYDPNTRTYTIYEQFAHSWPELYIDGRWLPFEPTPVLPLPARGTDVQESAPVQPAPAPVEPEQGWRGPLVWLLVLVVFGVLTLAGLGVFRQRRSIPLIAQVQAGFERLGRQLGVPWPSGATLSEYGELLGARIQDAPSEVKNVATLLGTARYAGRPLTGEEERHLDENWRRVQDATQTRAK